MAGPYELERFVSAQAPVYEHVLAELTTGRKTSHWMWFIFPQIEGLGFSDMAKRYAIQTRAEAEAYLKHEVLGPRLRTCTGLVNKIEGRSIATIFGSPDDMKFHSSMTLFSSVAPGGLFQDALAKYFKGALDPATVARLD